MTIEAPRLIDDAGKPVDFDGPAYSKEADRDRLQGQILRVFYVMQDGQWRTLEEIRAAIELAHGHHDPEASISAQLRHLRKPKFGGYKVDKRHRGDAARGLYEYRLEVPTS